MLNWLEPYWLSALSILATAVGLGFLLFIHEFGHFFVAKRAGVKVEVFSLGIAHFLFSWTWKGTVYALSWLPLGGYVRMSGQQDLAPPPGHKPLPHEYGAKKPLVRMAIIAAGVTMNFIAGYLCFAAAFYSGREVIPPVVAKFDEKAPRFAEAYAAGLRPGDKILKVDGHPVYTQMSLIMRVARITPGSKATFEVEHKDGSREKIELTTFEGGARGISASVPTAGIPSTEISRRLGFTAERRLVIEADPKTLRKKFSAWDKLFDAGDEVVTVNGLPCSSEKEMKAFFKESRGKDLDLKVRSTTGAERDVTLPVSPRYTVGIELDGTGDTVKVGRTVPGQPAEAAGVMAGDSIYVETGGRRQPLQADAFIARVNDAGRSGSPIEVVLVSRDGQSRKASITPEASTWYPDPAGSHNYDAPLPWGDLPVVRKVYEGTSAEAKGLKAGAVLADISYKVEKNRPVTLNWSWGQKMSGWHRIDIAGHGPEVTLRLPLQERLSLDATSSLSAAWSETSETLLSTTVILKKLSGGKITGDAVSGPIGIAQMAYHQAQEGMGELLWLLGLMGVSLAFFNLLPIPVLDGGHMVFLGYEAVFRKPPSARVVEIAQYAGLLIIASLFVLVFWNDISRLIRTG